jgi:membrane associated rhomboid family serine protease
MILPHETEPRLSREPMLNLPRVVTALIALMIGIEALRGFLTPETDFEWTLAFAFVPFRVSAALGWDPLPVLEAAAADAPRRGVEAGRAALGLFLTERGDGVAPWTFVTHAFLHGGWIHVFLNSFWLAAFGSPLARRFGATRFLAFFAIAASGGAATHFFLHWTDPIPLVGASGAISGCMAAAAFFMFARDADIDGFERVAWLRPAMDVSEAMKDRRVLMFLLSWIVINVVVGLSGATLGAAGEIAWEAHLGGFAVGLLLFRFFDRRIRVRPLRL